MSRPMHIDISDGYDDYEKLKKERELKIEELKLKSDDKEFALEAIEFCGGHVIKYCSENLRDDEEIVSRAVKGNYGNEFFYASDRLKNNKEFIYKICKDTWKGCNILPYINQDFFLEKEFIYKVAEFRARDTLSQLKDNDFGKNVNFVFEFLEQFLDSKNDDLMYELSDNVRLDKEFWKKIISSDKELHKIHLALCPREILNDYEIVSLILKKGRPCIEKMSEGLESFSEKQIKDLVSISKYPIHSEEFRLPDNFMNEIMNSYPRQQSSLLFCREQVEYKSCNRIYTIGPDVDSGEFYVDHIPKGYISLSESCLGDEFDELFLINIERACKEVRAGKLHYDVPEDYMGLIIGKNGSNLNKVVNLLKKEGVNVSRIILHAKSKEQWQIHLKGIKQSIEARNVIDRGEG